MTKIKTCPPGWKVYERTISERGFTVRAALDPHFTTPEILEATNWSLSKDQTSPVYDIMVQRAGTCNDPNCENPYCLATQARLSEEQKEEGDHTTSTWNAKHGPVGAPVRLPEETKSKKVGKFTAHHAQLVKEGRVPDDVAHHRLAICTGITVEGKKVSTPCLRYQDEKQGWGTGYCRGCGCADWPIAQMHFPKSGFLKVLDGLMPGKAWFPMGCPIGRFSDHPGRKTLKKDEQAPTMRDNDADLPPTTG